MGSGTLQPQAGVLASRGGTAATGRRPPAVACRPPASRHWRRQAEGVLRPPTAGLLPCRCARRSFSVGTPPREAATGWQLGEFSMGSCQPLLLLPCREAKPSALLTVGAMPHLGGFRGWRVGGCDAPKSVGGRLTAGDHLDDQGTGVSLRGKCGPAWASQLSGCVNPQPMPGHSRRRMRHPFRENLTLQAPHVLADAAAARLRCLELT